MPHSLGSYALLCRGMPTGSRHCERLLTTPPASTFCYPHWLAARKEVPAHKARASGVLSPACVALTRSGFWRA
ncbi:hypothetical protein V5799_026353 [Amblyomma americanum]|uniref:Uncharacterized protein n=1 Tax=Amblyomma americanum TaxID=6943 RepID=A0AAQ4DIT9_AMBAM